MDLLGQIANQPGQQELNKVVKKVRRQLPEPKELRKNVPVGLTLAIAEIPDGMANALLVGVNPVYGLYANIVGPFIGGIFASSQMMTIVTTSAASLTVSQSIANLPMEEKATVLFLTVILSGCFQILLAFLGAARLIQFVSYSVMTGLLAGIGCLLALSQLPTVMGLEGTGQNKVFQTIHLMGNLDALNYSTLSLAILTLILGVFLPRTRIRTYGTLIAIVVPSIIAALFNLVEVKNVNDFATIPSGIPMPHLPSFEGLINAIPGALAVSIVVLVQGAGVGQGVPNPDGSRTILMRDFIAQGAANIVSGLFRGLPVGGSFSATTLNVVAGGNSRLASIFAGIWILVIVVSFSKLMGAIVMASLGALLILVGIRSVIGSEYRSIWMAGWPSRLAFLLTFIATLLAPIELAVASGVVFSGGLYVVSSASMLSVVKLFQMPDGRVQEHPLPAKLSDNEILVLEVHGNLFFGGARTLESRLPDPAGSKNPVIILRLRNHMNIGATLIEVLSHYSRKLNEVDGRLYISGVSHNVLEELEHSGKLQLKGPVKVFEKTSILCESTSIAYADAQAWLTSLKKEEKNENGK